MIRSRLTTVAAFAVALLLAGCVGGCTAPKTPDTPPSIRGVVTSVSPGADGLGAVLIEESAPQGLEFDKASLTLTKDTEVLKQVGDGYQVVAFEALLEGVLVEAWVTGPVRESYPIQADADVVLVLE